MSIVASILLEDRAQADGRRAITERHQDHLGLWHFVRYIAENAADASAAMLARVTGLEERLKQAEIDRNVARALDGFTNGFSFAWSTANDNLAALREIYRTATRWELLTLAHVLHHQSLSDAQIRGLFGVAQNQVSAVRSKLAALDAKYHDVLDDVGD